MVIHMGNALGRRNPRDDWARVKRGFWNNCKPQSVFSERPSRSLNRIHGWRCPSVGLMAGGNYLKTLYPQSHLKQPSVLVPECIAARRYGVFMRPLGDTLIFVPLSRLPRMKLKMTEAASKAIADVLGEP